MSLLDRTFQIERGWDLDNQGNYAEPLDINPGDVIPQGTIVELDPGGLAVLANTPDITKDPKKQVWLVQSGSDDYDGDYLAKINGIARFVIAEIDPPCFDQTLAYKKDDLLTFKKGLFTPKTAAGDQVIAKVREVLVSGNMKIDYFGYVGP